MKNLTINPAIVKFNSLVDSFQRYIMFFWLSSPTTIDKQADWGEGDDNYQMFPNGTYLKASDGTGDIEISHGVQPNEAGTAPLGWTYNSPNRYDKLSIWVSHEIYPAGTKLTVKTADNVKPLEYICKKDSVLVANYLPSGEPNTDDVWVQTVENLEKNYDIKLSEVIA